MHNSHSHVVNFHHVSRRQVANSKVKKEGKGPMDLWQHGWQNLAQDQFWSEIVVLSRHNRPQLPNLAWCLFIPFWAWQVGSTVELNWIQKNKDLYKHLFLPVLKDLRGFAAEVTNNKVAPRLDSHSREESQPATHLFASAPELFIDSFVSSVELHWCCLGKRL